MALTDPSINLQSIQNTFISTRNKLMYIPSCPKKHRILLYEKYHHRLSCGLVISRSESTIGHSCFKCGKDLEVNPFALVSQFQ